MLLECQSRTDIFITCKTRNSPIFQVGQPHTHGNSYLDRVRHQRVDGTLILDVASPSLIERQTAAGAQPAMEAFKLAQKKNWSLPRVSASGREMDRVQVGPSLTNLVRDNRALVTQLKHYRTSIGRNVLAQNDTLRRRTWTSNAHYNRMISNTAIKVPSAKITRPKGVLRKLPRLPIRKLDDQVALMKNTEVRSV